MGELSKEIEDEFQAGCAVLFGLRLTEQQMAQFRMYQRLLISGNERLNLTAIIEPVDIYRKHFLDSASLATVIGADDTARLLDVGSGAGLPGVALKILFPNLDVTLCDALQKRVHFLQSVIAELDLQGIRAIHGRAEDLSHDTGHRDRYDWVTARAVAQLATLVEWCLPFVKPGGRFIAMKGPDVSEEVAQASAAMAALRAQCTGVSPYELTGGAGNRSLVVCEKLGATPRRFPRKPGVAKRAPLS